MSFIPYQEYVSAGIGWLDEVPAHWGKVPLKYTALESDSLFLDGDWIESKDISDDGIKYITTGNVGEGVYKEQGAGFITDEVFDRLRCTEVFPGDILVSRLNYPIGRSCIIPDLSARIVTSVDNVIYRPDGHFNKSYLVYLMSSGEYFSHTSDLARGTTMQRISRSLLGNIRIPVPTPEEQIRIAAFLDHETAKIDALIAEQQRLIELLKEKRQAVISHAVTKGLNPNAPMKDSGVEWLGEVPAHWELKKLRHIGHARNGLTYSPEDVVDLSDAATLVLRSSNIQKAKITLRDNVYVEKRIPEALRVREGDLLICSRNGSRALIGKNALIPKELDGQSFGAFMMVFRSGVNKFIYWVLNSKIFDYQSSTFLTATINQLTNENLGGMLAPFPPPAEQAEIVSFLVEKSQEIDILISEVEGGVELLCERRSALISAAVTGKIDVRSWRPPDVKAESNGRVYTEILF